MQSDTPRDERSNSGTDVTSLLLAAAAGATAMYFMDPERGRRRRHLATDKLVHAAHVAGDAVEATSHDLANHARGIGSFTRRPFTADDADDVVIEERVRSELGRTASHFGAIQVAVEQGQATLSGPVLADEADRLLSAAAGVRGVRGVEDRLDRHQQPGNIPALQGSPSPPVERFELLQENWTPAARLLTAVAGGALAALALRDGRMKDPLSSLLGIAGLALFARGSTNMPFDRLFGTGAGRRAVIVQKSINIAAPIHEVFAWLTEWERWPEWMTHVREVTSSGPRGEVGERTHWVVDGPAGKSVSWDAVTTRIEPPTQIAWKSVEGSAIAHAGRLRLIESDDGFTRVDVHMTYNPVVGAVGHAVASLFGVDPKHQLDDDLARLKTTIETGRAPHDASRQAHRPAASEVGPGGP